MSRKYHAFYEAAACGEQNKHLLKEPLRTNAAGYVKEKKRRPDISRECRINRTIFLTLPEAAEFYSIGLTTLREITKKSGSIKTIGRRKWINTNIFDQYLEQFRT